MGGIGWVISKVMSNEGDLELRKFNERDLDWSVVFFFANLSDLSGVTSSSSNMNSSRNRYSVLASSIHLLNLVLELAARSLQVSIRKFCSRNA